MICSNALKVLRFQLSKEFWREKNKQQFLTVLMVERMRPKHFSDIKKGHNTVRKDYLLSIRKRLSWAMKGKLNKLCRQTPVFKQ